MIIGVHGIGKQQLGRQQLLELWKPAVGDGLERAHGSRVPDPPLDIAFYGDFFPASTEHGQTSFKGHVVPDDLESELAALTDEELVDLDEAIRQAVTGDDIAAAARVESKGYTRTPQPMQILLRAMDRRFRPGAGVLYVGAMRQVRQYLRDPIVKAAVDDAVRVAIPAECRILVGHSLGSVVAFEFVRQNPDQLLDLLLTIGSPLGLTMVRRLMPAATYAADLGKPASVARWVNIRDAHDPVTCAGSLQSRWAGIDDRLVDNGGDAHSAARYLSKKQTGCALLAADPGLAG